MSGLDSTQNWSSLAVSSLPSRRCCYPGLTAFCADTLTRSLRTNPETRSASV